MVFAIIIMKNQKAIGEYTELQCITYLVGLGYTVSTPYGDNAPYDFILEVDNKLYKIQCKTAFVVDEGVWGIRLRRVRINSKQYVRKGYTSDEVDFFSTFIEGRCYLVPFSEANSSEQRLRFVPPKRKVPYTDASIYEAEKQIALLME